MDFSEEFFRAFHVDRNYVAIGLLFWARATISTKTNKFFDEIGVDHTFLRLLGEKITIDSLGIIHHNY